MLIKRIILYIFGLLVMGFGVAFSVNSDLGVTPVSSLPYVLSLMGGVSMGVVVVITNLVFILLQFVLLGRDFKLIELTQIIFSFIFGYFVDFAMMILGDFVFPAYLGQLAMMVVGTLLLTTGIVLYMKAKLVNLPPEGLAAAIATKLPGGKFHTAKVGMDSGLVVIALALSFWFLGGIYGVREGTVFAAVFIGKLIPVIGKIVDPVLRKLDFEVEDL